MEPKSLFDRLNIWIWKIEWQDKLDRADDFHDDMHKIYCIIQENEHFHKMLGYILAVGNVLNAGSNKGQADGFDLPVLGKCHTFKDIHGASVLHYVCKKMKDEDPTFSDEMRKI